MALQTSNKVTFHSGGFIRVCTFGSEAVSEDLDTDVGAEVCWYGERDGATGVVHSTGDVDPHTFPDLLPVLEVKTTNNE